MKDTQKNIIYIKGYSQDNSTESSTFEKLKVFENQNTKFHIFTPDYSSMESFNRNKEEIIKLIKKSKNTTVIGSSFGGMMAMYIMSQHKEKSILINPQIRPLDTKQNISETTLSFYKIIENTILPSLILSDYTYNLVLLGEKDTVIPAKYYLNSEYMEYTQKVIIDKNEGHKFENILNYTTDIENVIDK